MLSCTCIKFWSIFERGHFKTSLVGAFLHFLIFPIYPRMRNPIPCRVFEKTHLRMDLRQGTSKHGFEAKITFVSSFFFKKETQQ